MNDLGSNGVLRHIIFTAVCFWLMALLALAALIITEIHDAFVVVALFLNVIGGGYSTIRLAIYASHSRHAIYVVIPRKKVKPIPLPSPAGDLGRDWSR